MISRKADDFVLVYYDFGSSVYIPNDILIITDLVLLFKFLRASLLCATPCYVCLVEFKAIVYLTCDL